MGHFAALNLPDMFAKVNLITSEEHGKLHDDFIHCLSGFPTVWEKGQMYSNHRL